MEKVRLALIGAGRRAQFWLGELLAMDDVEVTAVCDPYVDLMEAFQKQCEEKYGHPVYANPDYREVIKNAPCDAVFAACFWEDHIRIATTAMKAGKYAAMEVAPAQSIQQCWDLVRTYEETGVPCMILENCCYGKNELTVLNMIKKGIFGEITRCEGGYQHDLRASSTLHRVPGKEHGRRYHYMHRNGELYPTHELGPMMKYVGIHNGNRMLSLTSTACKARGMTKCGYDHLDPSDRYYGATFNQGDVVDTLIKCANGETLHLVQDVCSPRPYSRGGRVQGTNGLWMEDKDAAYFEGVSEPEKWDPMSKYHEQYGHPLWKKSGADDVQEGHGGMDWLVMRAFINAVKDGTEVPLDVYDAAAMMCVSVLSEESIAMGSMPVPIPDFTDGRWVYPKPASKSVFSLEEVDDSLFEGDIKL